MATSDAVHQLLHTPVNEMHDHVSSVVQRSGQKSRMGGRLNNNFALPVMAMFALSLLVTWRLYLNAQQNAKQTLQAQFDFRARSISNEIVKRMGTYEQVMRGVDGLFAHAGSVTRDEFHDYVERLDLKENYPGIQGIRFSPAVPLAEKTSHVAAMRRQGMGAYTIHPDGKRELYAPVVYIEPDDEINRVIFGYDTYSDLEHPQPGDSVAGARRAAMERARDTGKAALSGKIRLLFETDQSAQASFLMFLPVYRHEAPHGTLAERRANIIGWVSSVFRADDLMDGILGHGDRDVDIDIYDGEAIHESSLMHDSDNSRFSRGNLPAAHFHATQQLDIAGRTWTMVVSSLPAFETMQDTGKPQLIGVGGFVTGVMLTLLTWLLLYDRARALRAAAALERESRKNRTLLRTAADGMYVFDTNGDMVQVNDAFCRMLGYTEQELLSMNVAQWNAQWPKEELLAKIAALGSSNPPFETRHRRRDGSIIQVEISASRVEIDGRQLVYNSARDITGRKQSEQAIKDSEARLHTLVETAMDAVVIMDSGGAITGWNNQAANIFGWSHDEVVGRLLHQTIIPPQFRESHVRGLKRFLESGEAPLLNSRIEISALHRDGREFPIELSVTPIKMQNEYEFSAFIRDITKKKQFEDLIWKQANYDTLTALPNRRMFHDRLAQEIKKAHRAGLMMALLFIDLDRFKEINDTLGHRVGDLLLVEAAQRIGNCLRETDTVARLGGDEFTVILSELDDASNVERIAENILKKRAEPFRLENEMVYLSASMGITLYPNDATEIEDLLKDADQAMYAAKSMGRNRLSYFTPALQQAAIARLKLINDLRGAMAAGQFMVYFQPITDMATGRVSKAEALIRWQHPERCMVSPMDFIPLAEETGLIFEIGDWVFRESARWVKRWREVIHPEFQVSVNKSPVQFYKEDEEHSAWIEHLHDLGLTGDCLVIEITEGLLLNSDASVTGALLTFRDAGIQVAIDDFGTGYSSLSYLKKFDIDYLKIDKSFTSHLTPGSSDMVLSEAIIVMAHQLGFKVVAEGVETVRQRDLLAAAGCDFAQGYLYSKPLPPEKFELLLKAHSGVLSAGGKCSKVEWDDKYMTGVGFMDEEHNELFGLIENCIQAICNHAPKEQQLMCLDKIASYLSRHCAREEEGMRTAGSHRFDEHIKQHQHIVEKINLMISQFRNDRDAISTQDILHVLFDWFVIHNAGEDRKLADYFRVAGEHGKPGTTS
ncbi:MAG: EAL domain-containing protein [Nitrosomonadales bacterium]|nr:EAL domain-containing protein [Nitrosomonadales bacterium]